MFEKPDNLIAVLDIETTGLNPNNGTIVEIGICSLDLDTGNIEPLFDSVVQEKNLIHSRFLASSLEESWVFLNSDLSLDEVLNAPDIEEVRGEVQGIMDNFAITAYNLSFDFGFLEDRGFIIPNPLPCPMIAATPVLKLPSRYGYKWPSVQEAWEYLYPDENYYSETHRAYDDACHEAKIVYALNQLGVWSID